MKDLVSVTIFLSRAINFFLLIRPANPQKVYYILSKKTDDFNNNLKFRAEDSIIIVTQMTANKCIIFLSTLFLAAIPAMGKDLEMTKRIGAYEIKVSIDKNPPILGNNKIEIEILDADGISITDAKVLVNYYMPPMPRMSPMNYTTKTDLKDKKYKAKMKLIMAGPWILAIKISREKKRFTAKFNIDAR